MIINVTYWAHGMYSIYISSFYYPPFLSLFPCVLSLELKKKMFCGEKNRSYSLYRAKPVEDQEFHVVQPNKCSEHRKWP